MIVLMAAFMVSKIFWLKVDMIKDMQKLKKHEWTIDDIMLGINLFLFDVNQNEACQLLNEVNLESKRFQLILFYANWSKKIQLVQHDIHDDSNFWMSWKALKNSSLGS